MRQVMPHRNNIVADPTIARTFFIKVQAYHRFERTSDRLLQLTRV
jgi:hypothetical protein